jgi:hypothetical protein
LAQLLGWRKLTEMGWKVAVVAWSAGRIAAMMAGHG